MQLLIKNNLLHFWSFKIIRAAIRDFLKKIDAALLRSESYPDLNAINELRYGIPINTFDCDGVVQINKDIGGVYPGPKDVIITGRSYQEKPETDAMLLRRGIGNKVFYNQLAFDKKTRESSGEHKANTIKYLQKRGYKVKAHFEDDTIQAKIIAEKCPEIKVILLVHNLTELENVRHLDE